MMIVVTLRDCTCLISMDNSQRSSLMLKSTFFLDNNLCFSFRFDAGGPGSCLKRYSDPTFFRRLSETAIGVSAKKITKDKKGHRSKVF